MTEDTGREQTGRVATRRHDWRLLTRTMYGWDLYGCRRCGYEDFPTPFGFMPFWKRCRA